MSNNTITIGLDLGYGLTKAVADNGRQVCFESRVAPAEFIRFQADIGAQVRTNGLTLHDPEEGPLFVGELASKQGRPGAIRSPRDRNRVTDPITTHLADAAFAMLLPGGSIPGSGWSPDFQSRSTAMLSSSRSIYGAPIRSCWMAAA